MSDLVREAEGLIAGMALLEELEPSPEIPQYSSTLDWPEQKDLECHRFVDFLDQLKVSSDGQSVTCPFQTCGERNRIPLNGIDEETWNRELASHCWFKHGMMLPLCFNISDGPGVRDALENLYVKVQKQRTENSRLAALLAIGCIRMPSSATVPLTAKALQVPVWGSSSQYHKEQTLVSITSRKSNWEQFTVLRSLRLRFMLLHRKLSQAIPRLANETYETLVHEHRESFLGVNERFRVWMLLRGPWARRDRLLGDSNFKISLSDGLERLMELLTGRLRPANTGVGSILALFCLGSAMADTMRARGKNVDFNLSEREILSWGSEMKLWQRVYLEKVVKFLWPRLADGRDEADMLLSCRDGFYDEVIDDTPGILQSFEMLLEESQLDDNFFFAGWLEGSADFHNYSPLHMSQHGHFPREAQCRNTELSTEPTKNDISHNQLETSVQSKRTTLIHIAVAFLLFLSSLGVILHYLSESLEHALGAPELLSAAADKTFSTFAESAKSNILAPLCLHEALKNFQPIFRTASKILESGRLPSVRHLEKWLLSAIKPFATTKCLHICAVAEIIHLCSDRPKAVLPEQQSVFCDSLQESGAESEVDLWARVAVEDDGFVPGRQDQIFETAREWESFSQEMRWREHVMESRSSVSEASASPRAKRMCISPSSSGTYTASESPVSPTTSSSTSQTITPEVSGADTTIRSCDVTDCGKVFKGAHSGNSLARHKREKHGASSAALEPTFGCPAEGCNHKAHRRHNLRDHWERKHPGMEVPASLSGPSSVSEGRGRKRKSEAAE